jgi:hypothetical protein
MNFRSTTCRRVPEIKPIVPEFLAAKISDLAAPDAMFFVDTGTACTSGHKQSEGSERGSDMIVR